MNDYSLKFANYWRNSLADAENGNGALSAHQIEKLAPLTTEALTAGCLPEELVSQLFSDEPADSSHVEATLRPFIYRARLEHGKARQGRPTFVTPVVCHVLAARDGRLYPTCKTLMPRDILDPLDLGNFAIGGQSDLDAFLSVKDVPLFGQPVENEESDTDQHRRKWNVYLDYCRDMVSTVTGGWNGTEDDYDLVDKAYLFKENNADGFSQHIVSLYDHLREGKPDAPLFDRFAQRDPSPVEDCALPNSQFAARLGHAGDRYALAPAQRDALTHLLMGNEGDVLAVNGPPGTGKTTLLLSVVASLWAKAALAGGDPPVIVASSTNNQAVTNIINAFGKDFSEGSGPFAGRWLPDIASFGAYFPSAKAGMSCTYQTKSFFVKCETEAYLAAAQQAYLTRAAAAFADETSLNVQDVVERLQAAIRSKQQQLADIEHAWSKLVEAREAISAVLGDDPEAGFERLETQHLRQTEVLAGLKARLKDFKHYLAHEPLLYSLFGWIGPVAAKRLRLAKLHLDEIAPELRDVTSVSDIETLLTASVTHESELEKTLEAKLNQARKLVQAERHQVLNWQDKISVLPIPDESPAAQITLNDCDGWADTSLRFEVFLLATHYWEGRWLIEVGQTLPEIQSSRTKTGRKTLEKNWRRWMKLTPCVVATFFRLPNEMQCKRHDGTGFVEDYALNFIDLLIVDEAGQVLPEVAAPSFALAKQALVIGDTQQIEPIWSIPSAVDIGNLISAGLLSYDDVDDDYAAFCDSGRSAANGSVMAVAQGTSRYHYDSDLARGMFLYEHRRCYDSIIEYCNALCYKGKLQPLRGLKPEAVCLV